MLPGAICLLEFIQPVGGENPPEGGNPQTMAAKNGISDNPISLLLFSEPYRFDFFQAVRLLERIYPTRGPVGESGPVSQEVVRFAAHASLDFPPSEIYDLTRQQSSDPNGQPRMVVAFMGLTGPSGVLLTLYTELVIERI